MTTKRGIFGNSHSSTFPTIISIPEQMGYSFPLKSHGTGGNFTALLTSSEDTVNQHRNNSYRTHQATLHNLDIISHNDNNDHILLPKKTFYALQFTFKILIHHQEAK